MPEEYPSIIVNIDSKNILTAVRQFTIAGPLKMNDSAASGGVSPETLMMNPASGQAEWNPASQPSRTA